VVDSSGRNTKAPQWLQEMGYGETPIGRVNSFLGYASRSYRPPADLDDAWHMIGIGSSPPDRPQSAVLLKQEDGSWLVTLAGREKKYPPLDEEGFLAYSQTIDPQVHNFLQTAEPLSKIVGYQRTENMWHHYEALTRWPDGFIAVGDSVCAFNPVYGQGMTASAMDAELLQKMLNTSAPHTAGWSQRFQKALAKEVKLPIWTLATGEDFRWPMTEGKQEGLSTKLSHWYVKQLIPVLPHDTEVIRTFMLVQQLLKPATYMARPAILWRLFKFHVKNLFRSKPMKTQIVAEHVHSV
ncbi:MAG: hypothetical protein KDE51_26460, partial [Anaerolineales bacterium]|nr:hypothetical protein [Anaerolineales bacterium]